MRESGVVASWEGDDKLACRLLCAGDRNTPGSEQAWREDGVLEEQRFEDLLLDLLLRCARTPHLDAHLMVNLHRATACARVQCRAC